MSVHIAAMVLTSSPNTARARTAKGGGVPRRMTRSSLVWRVITLRLRRARDAQSPPAGRRPCLRRSRFICLAPSFFLGLGG